jgi:hypothetical protein
MPIPAEVLRYMNAQIKNPSQELMGWIRTNAHTRTDGGGYTIYTAECNRCFEITNATLYEYLDSTKNTVQIKTIEVDCCTVM